MVEAIFNTVGTGLTQFTGIIGNGFEGVISIFWDSTSSALTMTGELCLIGVAVGLGYWAFRLIRGLIRI